MLVEAEIDRAIQEENSYQVRVRKEAKEKAKKKQRENQEETDPVPTIAAQAESLAGRIASSSTETDKDRQVRRDDVLTEMKRERPETSDEDLAREIEDEAKKKPFGIGFFESEGGVFVKPDFGNSLQRMALINTEHPFFKTVYTRLLDLSDPMPRQAVDLLLIAMAKAELEANADTVARLKNVREVHWSPFLMNAYTLLSDIDGPDIDDEEEAEENGGT